MLFVMRDQWSLTCLYTFLFISCYVFGRLCGVSCFKRQRGSLIFRSNGLCVNNNINTKSHVIHNIYDNCESDDDDSDNENDKRKISRYRGVSSSEDEYVDEEDESSVDGEDMVVSENDSDSMDDNYKPRRKRKIVIVINLQCEMVNR